MDIVTPTPTSVYRYYDKAGALLYVGITSRGTRRQAEHNHDKEWWPFVVRQEVEHYSSRSEAAAREKGLIHQYRPPFNRQHNAGHAELREIYLAARDWLPYVAELPANEPVMDPREAFALVRGRVPLTQVDSGNIATFATSPTFRGLLRAIVPHDGEVLLLAPRKRGVLVDIDVFSPMPQIKFHGKRGGIPTLRGVHLHLKVERQNPFWVRAHEARGEAAA